MTEIEVMPTYKQNFELFLAKLERLFFALLEQGETQDSATVAGPRGQRSPE
jgi:hypothetical protein